MRAHERRLRDAVAALVKARRGSAAGGDDLLARMLRASDAETGQSMSDDLLVDNIVSFLMAGYDTIAFSLTWTLYLISQSPEWEARMVEEIERVAGSGPITSAHVQHLVIVQQVLNESLRLFPAAPIIVASPDSAASRRANLLWGTVPVQSDDTDLRDPHLLARQLAVEDASLFVEPDFAHAEARSVVLHQRAVFEREHDALLTRGEFRNRQFDDR